MINNNKIKHTKGVNIKMAEKQLRQSNNVIEVEGKITEIELEEVDYGQGEKIKGTIKIQTDENNVVPIEVFANKYTKAGALSGIVTVMNEYKAGEKVRIGNGNHRENKYIHQDGSLRSYPQIQSMFFNRVEGNINPTSKFSIEMYITSIKDEIYREEETGRKLINGYGIGYDGKLIPVTVIAIPPLADKVDANFEKGDTATFHGNVVNIEKKIEKVIESDFGEDEVVITKIYERGYIVMGGKKASDEKAYNSKDIKALESEREIDIQAMKDKKAKSGSQSSNNSNRANNNKKESDPFGDDPFADDNKSIDISDDDLPF